MWAVPESCSPYRLSMSQPQKDDVQVCMVLTMSFGGQTAGCRHRCKDTHGCHHAGAEGGLCTEQAVNWLGQEGCHGSKQRGRLRRCHACLQDPAHHCVCYWRDHAQAGSLPLIAMHMTDMVPLFC